MYKEITILFSFKNLIIILILFNLNIYADDSIKEYSYFEDTTSSKTIYDVLKFYNWEKTENEDFGYSRNPYWLKFSIDVKKEVDDNKYFLVSNYQRSEYLDVYIVENGKVISSFERGLKRPKNLENFFTRKDYFPISVNSDNIEIYIKLKNDYYPLRADFHILTHDSLLNFITTDNLIILIFFILLIILFIFHILIYLITKTNFYKYYLTYLFFLIIVELTNTGIFNIYLFKNGLDDFIICFIRMLGLVMIIYLVRLFKSLLEINLYNKKFSKIINYMIVSLILLLFVSDLLSSYGYQSKIIIYFLNINFTILISFILYIIMLRSIEKCFLSYLLILIWFPLLLSLILLTINDIYSLIDARIMQYIINFIFIYESIFISLIIAYKSKLIEEEKNRLLLVAKDNEIFYLRQSKLATMGEMINNIAHQWKQPLSRINAILFELNLLNEQKKLDKNIIQNKINFIEEETLLMSETISSFTNFIHPNKKLSNINLYELVSKKIDFIKKININIDITINCNDKNIYTIGYKEEYEQVILVLLENAFDSFKNNNTKNPKIDFCIEIFENEPRLIIENNAGIIDIENIDKIFEAYFSTKNKSTNSGLGLYMAKMLIENSMNKKLSVENTTDGVKFFIVG